MKKWLSVLLCLLLMAAPMLALAQETAPELGEDVYGFVISVDGQVFSVPTTLQAFLDEGWVFSGDKDVTLNPNQYSFSQRMKKGDGEIYVSFINLDINTLPMQECEVGGVSASADRVAEMQVLLPAGIELGKSTPEDVVAAYGKPSDENESTYSIRYTYEMDTYEAIKLTFDIETKLLSEVEIRNFVALNEPDYAAVSTEPPAIVETYVAPEALGDDLLSFNVEFSGKLYTIPAPFPEFAADGWTIKDAEDTVVAAHGWLFVDLRKDNTNMRTQLYNPGDTATLAKYCFVTKITSDDGFELVLPRGVTLDTSEAEMLEIYSDIEPLRTDEGTNYHSFEYGLKITDTIDLITHIDGGDVYRIAMNNSVYPPSIGEEE